MTQIIKTCPAPHSTFKLDPFSILCLDFDEYSHVDPTVHDQFTSKISTCLSNINCVPFSIQVKAFLPPSKDGTREQQLCAIKWAVEQWQQYLLGKKFIAETDHANLNGRLPLPQTKLSLHAEHVCWTNTIPNCIIALAIKMQSPNILSHYPVLTAIHEENNTSCAV